MKKEHGKKAAKKAQSFAEYLLLLTVVAIVAISCLTYLGKQVRSLYINVDDEICQVNDSNASSIELAQASICKHLKLKKAV